MTSVNSVDNHQEITSSTERSPLILPTQQTSPNGIRNAPRHSITWVVF